MKRWTHAALAAVVCVVCVSGVKAEEESEEQETTVTQAELPQKVAATVNEFGAGGNFVKAVRGDEDGVPVYEVTLDKSGSKIEVQTTLDGELNMREETVENSALPKAALDQVMKKYPAAKVSRVERTLRSVYEVKIEHDGKREEVLVTPGGQFTKEPGELGSEEEHEEHEMKGKSRKADKEEEEESEEHEEHEGKKHKSERHSEEKE
jgi:hypothetical protein